MKGTIVRVTIEGKGQLVIKITIYANDIKGAIFKTEETNYQAIVCSQKLNDW